MTISLIHTTQSTKPASARAGDIDGPIWNEEHTLTMATGNVLGRTSSGDGAVEEISLAALSAAAGYVTLTGTETLTNKTIDTASNTITVVAADVSDFDTEVSNNTDVAANTAARHAAVTLAGTGTYLSLAGQEITVDPITESDISDLGTSIVLTSDIGSTVQAYDADLDTWATKTAPSGTVVGTSDTQTLTNKTISSAAFSGTQTGAFTTTGEIRIDSAGNATFTADRADSTSYASSFGLATAGTTNWLVGTVAGSTAFDILRYSGGVYQDTPFSINVSTGYLTTKRITAADKVTVSGAASAEINLSPASTGDAAIQVGQGRSGDGSSYFDLIGDTTYSDYGARLIRNSGANGASSFIHRGTGAIEFIAQDAGSIDFKTSNTSRMTINSSGDVNVVGALSKGSGSFKIDHPLKPETHHLVHSFVEGPQADNIYRGKVRLINGKATVNLDQAGRMTEGTFVALNTNVQCFTSNEEGWTPLRGKVNGNMLTIEAQDETSMDEVSWLVIGERHDPHMLNTDWTDENGRVITEPLKEHINGSI